MSNSIVKSLKSPSSDIGTSVFDSISPQKPSRRISSLVESSNFGYHNLFAQQLLAISETTNNGIVVPEQTPRLFENSQK